jgi:chaperonin GroES
MIKPTGNKILVEVATPREAFAKKDGLWVPGQSQDEAVQGTVVALGTGNRNNKGEIVPFEVVVGNTVLLGKYHGMEIKLDDKKYSLVTEDEILGIVESE